MTSGSARARPRRSVTSCRASTRRCLSSKPSIELRSWLGTSDPLVIPRGLVLDPCGAGSGGNQEGLGEHVLALALMPGDGQVALRVPAAAAAAELELAPDLVEGPAGPDGDRAPRYRDALLDVQPVAAPPVPDTEIVLIGQAVRQVEVRPISDGREADVEAPAAAEAPPDPAAEVNAEPDHEVILGFDDRVLLVLVVDVEDVGVPLGPQVPGGQFDLGRAVEPVGLVGREGRYGGLCRHESISFVQITWLNVAV